MKITTKEPFGTNGFFRLQNQQYLDNQRIAGKVAAQALSLLEDLVKNKTTKSLLELDTIVEEFIVKNNCTPTFKNYRKFPNVVCCSVNNTLVHGLPTDYKLQDGDLITFDLGTTYNHAIADTAVSCIFGEPKSNQHTRLLQTTINALNKGIEAIKVGNRLGCIGNAIYKYVKTTEFNVVLTYGGHGISIDSSGKEILHAQPFVANKADPNEGIRIQPGMVLCIEPQCTIGDNTTWTDKDGWSVCTKNINSHVEHTVYVHSDHVEIITDRG